MIQANNPEELRLLIEPFPFMTAEEKNEVVESAKEFLEFKGWLVQKYDNAREEVIDARIQMQLAAKMSEKLIKYGGDNMPQGMSDDELGLMVVSEAFNDIAKEEGYEKDLTECAKVLFSLDHKIEANIEKMIADGREEELEQFFKMMEQMGK